MSAPKSKSSYTSKGERQSISRDVAKAVKRDRSVIDKLMHKQKAWLAGKNPWVTVPNGNSSDTRARFIKVRAETEWGDPRKGFMFGGSKD